MVPVAVRLRFYDAMRSATIGLASARNSGVRFMVAVAASRTAAVFEVIQRHFGACAAFVMQFREFFVRAFELNRIGLARPGYVAGPSGAVYALVFIGRSGEPFPAGVEIYAIVPALEPLDETTVDRDLWALLRWMIEGTGGDWTVDDLEATGRLYKVPAVAP